jgi:putative transposase
LRKSRYSDDQIEAAIRQVESGVPVEEIVRKLGVSEATFSVWKKRLNRSTADTSELARLRFENAELKRLVIDLIFDRELCKATHARDEDSPPGPNLAAVEAAGLIART